MDSNKKKRAIIGQEMFDVILRRPENFTDRIISAISQHILRRGTDTKSKSKVANPESIRLNPKSRSNLAPKKSINGNCVKNIAMPLIIFIIRFNGTDLIVQKPPISFKATGNTENAFGNYKYD
jgi:hypothetical protein